MNKDFQQRLANLEARHGSVATATPQMGVSEQATLSGSERRGFSIPIFGILWGAGYAWCGQVLAPHIVALQSGTFVPDAETSGAVLFAVGSGLLFVLLIIISLIRMMMGKRGYWRTLVAACVSAFVFSISYGIYIALQT